MNALSAYLRSTLRSAWSGGFGEQARRAAIVAPLLALCGFASSLFFPAASGNIMALLTQAIDAAGISTAEGMDAAALLFASNLSAAFTTLLWGLVPFAYLAAFPLGLNFYLVGIMAAYYVQNGLGLGTYLVGILPHGIFELPALVLFCAAGLHLCARVTARLRGSKDIRLMQTISETSVIYLYVVLPLLAAAAIIEACVTPRLLALMLG